MLDINYVRSHPDEIREMLRRRNTEGPLDLVLEADGRQADSPGRDGNAEGAAQRGEQGNRTGRRIPPTARRRSPR